MLQPLKGLLNNSTSTFLTSPLGMKRILRTLLTAGVLSDLVETDGVPIPLALYQFHILEMTDVLSLWKVLGYKFLEGLCPPSAEKVSVLPAAVFVATLTTVLVLAVLHQVHFITTISQHPIQFIKTDHCFPWQIGKMHVLGFTGRQRGWKRSRATFWKNFPLKKCLKWGPNCFISHFSRGYRTHRTHEENLFHTFLIAVLKLVDRNISNLDISDHVWTFTFY